MHHSPLVKNHRMNEATRDPHCKLWTLRDDDVFTCCNKRTPLLGVLITRASVHGVAGGHVGNLCAFCSHLLQIYNFL